MIDHFTAFCRDSYCVFFYLVEKPKNKYFSVSFVKPLYSEADRPTHWRI